MWYSWFRPRILRTDQSYDESASQAMDFGSRNQKTHNFPLLPSLVCRHTNLFRHRYLYSIENANVSTTQIYADLVNSKKRETANKISLK